MTQTANSVQQDPKPLSSEFRLWVRRMWYDHVQELESYRLPVNYGSEEYFVKYKYWLKREFTNQRNVK